MKKEKKKSTFWKDFKAFISRGNIVDLAVAVVVGAAFTAIVNSVVNDVIKPLIALLVNGDMSELVVVLRAAVMNEAGEIVKEAITLNYGNLIMAILTFLIDAFVIFTAIRIVRQRGGRRRCRSGSGTRCGVRSRTRACARARRRETFPRRGGAARRDPRPFESGKKPNGK